MCRSQRGVNEEGHSSFNCDRDVKRSDVNFEWFPGRRTYRKSGVSGARQEYYMLHVKTREDYERVRRRPWQVGRKKTIVREDLIHDLQRGLLNFSFGKANVEDNHAEH